MTGYCPFCSIAAGESPADLVFQDEDVIAFRDIRPVAPTHILIIPRKHLASLVEAQAEDSALLGRLLLAAARIACQEGLTAGFRLVANTGARAGQSIFHLHFHLLGGRTLSWPPG